VDGCTSAKNVALGFTPGARNCNPERRKGGILLLKSKESTMQKIPDSSVQRDVLPARTIAKKLCRNHYKLYIAVSLNKNTHTGDKKGKKCFYWCFQFERAFSKIVVFIVL
jgi:hypothetical protein